MDIVNYQYTKLNHYDLTISLSEEKALTEQNGLSAILSDSAQIESSGAYYTKSMP